MKLNPDLVLERVGDDVIGLDSQKSLVLTFSGQHARVLGHVLDGTDVSEDEQAVQDLLSQGVLVESETASLTRRTMLVSGSAVAASGALVFALPATANASSPGGFAAPIFAPQPVQSFRQFSSGRLEDVQLPLSSLTNQADYDFTNVFLEWSFSPDSEEWFDFDKDGDKFIWDYEIEDLNLFVPSENKDEDGNLVLWIRARTGDLVSSPSRVTIEER